MITAAFLVGIAGAVAANKSRPPLYIKIDGDPTCHQHVGDLPDGCSTTGTNICTSGLTIYYQATPCVFAYRRP